MTRGTCTFAMMLLLLATSPVLAQEMASTSAARPATPGVMAIVPFRNRRVVDDAVSKTLASDPQSAKHATDDADWAHVMKRTPGDALIITTTNGLTQAPRGFLSADAAVLTVFRTESTVSAKEMKILIAVVVAHPDALTSMDIDSYYRDQDVRVVSGEVFVHGRKAGDITGLVERIMRQDVVDILGPPRVRGSGLATGIGAALGTVVGFFAGALVALNDNSHTGGWPIPALAIAGGFGGGYVGSSLTNHREEDVIYRR
jgi:hypothetical protein